MNFCRNSCLKRFKVSLQQRDALFIPEELVSTTDLFQQLRNFFFFSFSSCVKRKHRSFKKLSKFAIKSHFAFSSRRVLSRISL